MAGPVTHRLLTALGLEGDDDGPDDAAEASGSGGGEGLVLRQVGGSSSGSGPSSLAGSAEARGYVFSALAQLANRMPELFQVGALLDAALCRAVLCCVTGTRCAWPRGQQAARPMLIQPPHTHTQDNTGLASRLFEALAVEPPGSRAALQEALGALASSLASGISGSSDITAAAGGAGSAAGMQAAVAAATASASGAGAGAVDPEKLQEIEEMLLGSMSSDQVRRGDRLRLLAGWLPALFNSPTSVLSPRRPTLLPGGRASVCSAVGHQAVPPLTHAQQVWQHFALWRCSQPRPPCAVTCVMPHRTAPLHVLPSHQMPHHARALGTCACWLLVTPSQRCAT
jgi:hypothetical protein